MISPDQQSFLVFPDTHGQYETVARTIEHYESTIDHFVFLGDMINGPDSARLIGLVRGLGERASAIVGNHEWNLRTALATPFEAPDAQTESDEVLIQTCQTGVWPRYEYDMLKSYRLKRTRDWQHNAALLRHAMTETGDLAWLNSLPTYIETATFVGVHAGPVPDTPWAEQAKSLDINTAPAARLRAQPEQVFSGGLAHATSGLPENSARTLITGHAHLSLPAEERSSGGRVRLASNLGNGAPLYLWHDPKGLVIEVPLHQPSKAT